ncbi:MAG: HDOD domain-containing protein [Pseudomonadota bacterium]
MSQEKFEFVQQLAVDLNRGEVSLPSFPDVVIRIRQELEDADCDGDRLAKIVSTEAALASRILVYANSSHYNPAGANIVSLTAAIGRIGFLKLRSVAITYAVEQLHFSKELAGLRSELEQVWNESLRSAAMAESIATIVRRIDTEAAYLTGLLSRIGVLYILTKRGQFPALIDDADVRAELVAEWSAPIAESIASSWEFPESIVAALNPSEDIGASTDDASLADVLRIGEAALGTADLSFADSIPLRRLGIDEAGAERIRERFDSKMQSFAAAA